MAKALRPFSYTSTVNVPALLMELNCSIALSTYQAGKVVFLCATSHKSLVQLPRNFKKPMGIALKDNKMAIATLGEIVVLANAPEMAKDYPKNPNTYDALYLPRATYYTGALDLHDVAFSRDGLLAVNTQFSCLSLINDEYSFQPIWQPPFITELKPEDRCHLNGLAMVDDVPTYVTALGETDSYEGWRVNKSGGGIVMRISDGQVVLGGLPMPHSPRVYDGELYVLFSGKGQLAKVDQEKGTYEIVADLGGFARGMAKKGKYLFIGLSKIRKTSKNFQDLPVADIANHAGVVIVDLEYGEVVGKITYLASVDEIYDVQLIDNGLRPGIVSPEKRVHEYAITSTFSSFWRFKKKK